MRVRVRGQVLVWVQGGRRKWFGLLQYAPVLQLYIGPVGEGGCTGAGSGSGSGCLVCCIVLSSCCSGWYWVSASAALRRRHAYLYVGAGGVGTGAGPGIKGFGWPSRTVP